MTKSFSLQPLMNLAQHQNDAATRKLGQLNKLQQDAQEKLAALQQYRKDYQTRLHEAAQNGMGPTELRNFQMFINKLDEAINQQLRNVQQSQASTQIGRGVFDSTQRKLKSFDTLQQRHFDAQNKIAAKQEQKTLDEHTGRFTARKMQQSNEHNN
jgi:flagellar FliJ protein